MRLLLVRHGQSLANVERRIQDDDDPLTEFGRAQARAVGRHLAERGDVTHLYASPLARAYETASLVGTAIGLQPVAMPGLAEVNAGTAAGTLWEDWRVQHPEEAAKIESGSGRMEDRWLGGESGQEFADRVLAAYDELVTQHLGTDDVVTAVSHGGPLAWISARVHGDPEDVWPMERAIFQNCSVSELEVSPDGHGDPVGWNLVDHLADVSPGAV